MKERKNERNKIKRRNEKMKRDGGEEQTKRKGNSVDKKGERRKEKKKRKKNRQRERGRKGEKRKGEFSRHSNGRSLTVREEKSIHASKATRGYQNLGVLSNSTRYEIFIL